MSEAGGGSIGLKSSVIVSVLLAFWWVGIWRLALAANQQLFGTKHMVFLVLAPRLFGHLSSCGQPNWQARRYPRLID